MTKFKTMSKIMLACSLTLSLLLAGASLAGAESVKPARIVFASGNSVGTYYYVASGMAKVLTEKMDGVEATVEATSGSPLENLNFVFNSVDTLGIANYDALLKGISGDKEAGYRKALTPLKVLMAGHTQICYIVSLENGPVQGFADMKGKKIGSLTKGASIRAQLEAILEEYGLKSGKDYKLVPMTYSEQIDALKDGNLQVMTSGGGIPQSAIMDIASSNPVRLINIDQELKDKLSAKHPYWSFATIPAGTYKGQDEDVTVITVQTLLIGRADLDEDYVYTLVKTLFENNDELAAIHPEGRNWSRESTVKLFAEAKDLPWHPGVIRLVQELEN